MTLAVALQGDLAGGPRRLARKLDALGIHNWVYVGEDSVWRVRAERSLLSGSTRIETADQLQETAWELRREYIDWIASLSQTNASLTWWASELANKNAYTMLYPRLCSLVVLKRLIDEGLDDVLIVCSTPALLEGALEAAWSAGRPALQVATGRAISASRARLRASSYGLARRLLGMWASLAPALLRGRLVGPGSSRLRFGLDSSPGYRDRVLRDLGGTAGAAFGGPGSVLLFTWIDGRSFSADGVYVDPHLGHLPELLSDRGYRVAYLARILSTVSFGSAAAELLARPEQFFLRDLFLDETDRRACAAAARAFSPTIPDRTIGDVPVAGLAREHVEQYRWAIEEALSYERLIRNLARRGVRPSLIVYTHEGQSWEHVLLTAVRTHLPETKVVGYENLNMSRLALSMYPSQLEQGLRPLPDRIVTNGYRYRQILLAEGFPEALVREGCAVRHAELWTRVFLRDSRVGPTSVLVATEGSFGQTIELIDKTLRAFADDDRYVVTIKCHPLLDERHVRREAGLLADRGNVSFSSAPISDLLCSADVLLYTYTTVCYEALAAGIPPVFVRAENVVDLDQLEPYRALRWEGRTPAEIRQAVDEVAALDDMSLADWRRRARAAAEEALAPIRPDCVEAFIA